MSARKCFTRMGKVVSLALCVAFCTIALAMTACSGGDSRVAATVMGQNITEGQVIDYIKDYRESIECTSDEDWASYLAENDATASDFRSFAIYELAGDAIIDALAKQEGLSVDEQAVNDEIASLRKSLGATDDAEWKSLLKEYNMTEDSLKKQIGQENLSEQLYKKMIDPVQPTDDMMKTYIEDNLSDETAKHVRRITSTDKAALDGLVEKINASSNQAATFDELAKQADGSNYAAEVLGWDIENDDAAEAADEVEDLGVGQVSEVIDLDDGTYEIVLVDESYAFPAEGQSANLGNLPASLRDAIYSLTLADEWESRCSEWLSEKIDESLEIKDMPDGLAYDVDTTAAKEALANQAVEDGDGEEISLEDLGIEVDGDEVDIDEVDVEDDDAEEGEDE